MIIEVAALIVLAMCAVGLVILGVAGDVWDRRPLDPPLPAPEPEHRPRHAAWGETTRLRRPRD